MLFKRKAVTTQSQEPSFANKQVAFEGCIFILKSINMAQTYTCSELCSTMACDSYDDGNGTVNCRSCPVKIVKRRFTIPEVIINLIVTRAAESPWFVAHERIQIIDVDGYSYSGQVLCEDIPYINRAKNCQEVHVGTRIDLVYIFPELPPDKEIQAIQITCGGESARIILKESSAEDDIFSENYYSSVSSNKTMEEKYENTPDEPCSNSFSAYSFNERLNKLKILIFKRVNNSLLSYEIRALEESIEEKIYELDLEVTSQYRIHGSLPQELIDDFHDTVKNYRIKKTSIIAKEERNSIQLEKVSDLLKMDPYSFEHFCASLLESLGFEQIRVTPKSNDKGIDIIAVRSKEKYVVQCKRYKNSVGSPDMQGFIGAMKNAGADKGIYITTASFTREALIMARANGVETYDKAGLASLLNLQDDNSEIGPSIWD